MRKRTEEQASVSELCVGKSEDVGAFIRARRKTLKVTQKELSDLTGISVDGISRIEKADRSISMVTLLAIAEILGFKVRLSPEEVLNND